MVSQRQDGWRRAALLGSFVLLWLVSVSLVARSLELFSGYWHFSLLGVLGAIFANSTGAGGGVVFIPAFTQLGFSEAQAVATSFGIQCFGMTAGALTWWRHYRRHARDLHLWRSFVPIIALTGVASIAGLWLNYAAGWSAPASLHGLFSAFSLTLGIAILLIALRARPTREHSRLATPDVVAVLSIGLGGGVLTAWLSVGVGELLAIYLILRRYDIVMSVAAAVVVSALTVWAAAPQHFVIDPQVYWQVVVFAGPGAVVGGVYARTLVASLSARRLKIFFACWLLVIGAAGVA